MALPWIRNRDPFAFKTKLLRRSSIGDLFWMAYLDSFSTEAGLTSLGDAWRVGVDIRKGSVATGLSAGELFFGYNPRIDPTTKEKRDNSLPIRTWRTLGNIIKLFTEFPIRLVDNLVEAAFEDVYNTFKGKTGLWKIVPGILTFVLGIIHIPLKLTALLVRLTISYNKTCQEADAHNSAMKTRFLGNTARFLGLGIRVGLCFVVPFAFPIVISPLVTGIVAATVGSETIGMGVVSYNKQQNGPQKENNFLKIDDEELVEERSSDDKFMNENPFEDQFKELLKRPQNTNTNTSDNTKKVIFSTKPEPGTTNIPKNKDSTENSTPKP